MNKIYIFKSVFFIFNIVVILMSIQLGYQIERDQEEVVTIIKRDFERRNDRFMSMSADVNKILQDCQNMQDQYYRYREEYTQLQKKYKIKQYINYMGYELDQVTLQNSNVSRYFKVKKEELIRIISEDGIFKEMDIQELIDGDDKDFLSVGDGIWLQYKENEELPESLIVQNPEINIGYKEARAGMQLDYIKNLFSESMDDINILFWDTNPYLQFEDGDFKFYYIAFNGREKPTVLYIMQKGN